MIEDTNIIQRYAQALYQVAKTNSKLPQILADLGIVSQLLKALTSQFEYLSAPVAVFSLQKATFELLAKKYKFSPLTTNFLFMLCLNRRLHWLRLILDKFALLHKHAQGILDVEIRSAVKLSDKQVKEITTYLDKKLKKHSEANLIIDPALLGGLIIKFGSIEIDNSVANRLNRIRFNTRDFYQ